MKVLLIEDDKKIASAVKRGLQTEGFTVDVALNGPDGLWMATEGSYDAIVLDLATGKPVSDARVRACDREAAVFGKEACPAASTGETGLFHIKDLPRGTADVAAVAAV